MFLTMIQHVQSLTPNAKDYQRKLDLVLKIARQNGMSQIEIYARDLYKIADGHLRESPSMSNCCSVMKSKKYNSKIVSGPPSEQGNTLLIRYNL